MDKAITNLEKYLNNLNKPIPEFKVLRIVKQICLGIQHLHEDLKITHRDLKLENILIMKDKNIAISDFGDAKANEEEKFSISTKGKRRYAAPEVY